MPSSITFCEAKGGGAVAGVWSGSAADDWRCGMVGIRAGPACNRHTLHRLERNDRQRDASACISRVAQAFALVP